MPDDIKNMDLNILLEAVKNAPKNEPDPLLKVDLTTSMRLSISYWLRDCNITQGKISIRSCDLFKHYMNWCEAKKLPYVATHCIFGKVLSSLLQKQKLSKGAFYRINKDLLNEKKETKD